MPTPCNLKVKEYPGSSEKEGREGTCDVYEFEHLVQQPQAVGTGQASGVRIHGALRVVKVIDKATTGFHQALCTGEHLKEAVLTFYRIDPDSRSEREYYSITIKNVRVSEIKSSMPMTLLFANESYRHMEQVSFVYDEIEWSWKPDHMVTIDKWRFPGQGPTQS